MSIAHSEKRASDRRRVRVFAALGDETRLTIVRRLSAGTPLSISRLTEGQGQSRQSITKHLRVLSHAGVVRGVRRGRERCFELRPESLHDAHQSLERISRQWGIALERLKNMLERDRAGSDPTSTKL
jgi:DNA-binding transcriptional ArsR family regulator